jgi:hypothetical protein
MNNPFPPPSHGAFYGYPPTGYPPPGYPAAGHWPAPQPPPAPNNNSRFVQGLLFGGVAAYLLSNEAVQHNAIKAAVRTWSALQTGVEEMKERFRDAEAELHAASRHE